MKPLKLLPFAALAIVLVLSSCVRNFYSSTDAVTLAKKHKTIAILPPTVYIPGANIFTAAAISEQQKMESLNFQREMRSWMLQRKMHGLAAAIQDLEVTNAKLKLAGYPEKPVPLSELCSILGVDGIISSNFTLSKPAENPIHEVRATISLHDAGTQKLIWNYGHILRGDYARSSASLVNAHMRIASKSMPYSPFDTL
jgi:hypothetical protein